MKLHIYGALQNYKKSKPVRLHMPGHKANSKVCSLFHDAAMDITELSFSDCLESPDGIISLAELDIADILGAKKSHILTDGSTVGIYALVYAAKRHGGKLAIARNSHKSVYNACAVLGVEPYILKNNERDGILLPPTAADIEEVFRKERNISGVLLTSPDYFGNVVDLDAVRKICDTYDKILYVDGAHGAAMRFDAEERSLYAGNFADAWVDGAHKVFPTLTQGAILNVGEKGEDELFCEGLNLFRTTSPSYPIMASVEYGVKFMEEQGEGLLDTLRNEVMFLKAQLARRGVRCYDDGHTAVLAVDFGGSGLDAHAAALELERRNVYAELEDGRYILFYFSALTDPKTVKKLKKALCRVVRMRSLRIDWKDSANRFATGIKKFGYLTAHTLAYEYVPLNESVGRIAARSAGITPPCYPSVIAGEGITEQVAAALQSAPHTFGLKDKKIAVTKVGG